jgi:hypothetical protein
VGMEGVVVRMGVWDREGLGEGAYHCGMFLVRRGPRTGRELELMTVVDGGWRVGRWAALLSRCQPSG